MRPTLARRCRARRRRDRRRCGAAPGRGRGRRRAPRPSRSARPDPRSCGCCAGWGRRGRRSLTSDEPRPRCSASSNALRRHRAEVDLRPGLGVQEVGRRSPARALRPALRQPMQLAERVGHATPVGLRLGRSALHVGHHHQTVGEQPAVRRRDRHRHGQTFTVEVLQELGLPREISVAPLPRRPTARCPLTRTLHTSLRQLRQRAVRCERRRHPTARVPPIPRPHLRRRCSVDLDDLDLAADEA